MSRELIQASVFSIPAACALVCLVMLLLDISFSRKSREERQLRFFLSLTFMVAALSWLGLMFQVIAPEVFIRYSVVFTLTLMFDQILIYRFVHIITATERHSRFNRLHFVVPVLLTVVVELTGYAILTSVVFVVYNTLYPVLGILRIHRYRRSIEDYSADAQRTSLNWLLLMQALTLITIPVPLFGMLFNVDVFSGSWLSVQGALPAFFIYPILCYNLLSDNYVIVTPDDDAELPDIDSAMAAKNFAHYLRDKKPYLNPQLRITDVAVDLHSNRCSISALVNREYGMNFSRLINRCRLKELNRLRLSPDHSEKDNLELVLMAGFSSYRSYLRVKREEDRATVLKEF
ncbi:hypothetical protein AGMMS50239_25130 [Bacteroidia bacterium]|nr:hypothetical protein AGMMS50239_25130 [Bacteroidia bacterium]